MKRALLCVCLLVASVSSANLLAATAIQKSTLPGPGLGGGAGDGTIPGPGLGGDAGDGTIPGAGLGGGAGDGT